MKRKYKNITVPYFYFDKKKNIEYFIYQDKEYIKLNELFKDFVNYELTYHIEIKDKLKEVHNLEDVIELLVNNYKTFKIPKKYYDEYSKDELSYIQKLQKKLINKELKQELEPSYNHYFRLRDILYLKQINFDKKVFKNYQDIIIPKKIYFKEYKTHYYVIGGRYYTNYLDAIEDVYLNSFYYQFGGPNRENLYNHFHAHQFNEVINMLFWHYDKFKIHKFQEEFFSIQELELLNKLCSKLKQLKYKPVNREFDQEGYERYCYLVDNKKHIRLFIDYIYNEIKDIKYRKEVLKSHKI